MPDTNPHIDNSLEMDDFIGAHPSWLLRSGITITAGVLLVLLGLSYFIRYPDKIIARGILSAENPPIEVKSKVGGVIEKIFVSNQMEVAQDDPLLYIKNTAAAGDIKAIESFIELYENKSITKAQLKNKIPRSLNLGALQSMHGQLVLKIDEYTNALGFEDVDVQIRSKSNEIQNIEKLNTSVEKEKVILQAELDLVKAEASRAKKMLDKGIISIQAREKAESKYLQYQQKYERLSSSIISNNVRMERLRLEQVQLREGREKAISSFEFEIAKLVSNLKSGLAQWKDEFYLVAAESGTFSLNAAISEKMSIEKEESIGYIINADAGKKFIQILVPAQGIGKIQNGNTAIVKFDAYPHKEFGVLSATVADISIVPKRQDDDINYEVELAIPYKLITSYNRELPYQSNSAVTAEIITDNKTVLERIFYQFRDLISN